MINNIFKNVMNQIISDFPLFIYFDCLYHKYVNNLPAMSLTIQSIPSSKPYPVLALHPIIPQCLVLTV
jgi:hypothetical protein